MAGKWEYSLTDGELQADCGAANNIGNLNCGRCAASG